MLTAERVGRPGPIAAAAVLLVALTAWMNAERLPPAIYPTPNPHPALGISPVLASTPLEVRIPLERPVSRVHLPVLTDAERAALQVVVRPWSKGAARRPGPRLAEVEVMRSGVVAIDLGPMDGDETGIALSIESEAIAPESAPSVMWSERPPLTGILVRRAEQPLSAFPRLPATGPLFVLEYRWPMRSALLAWLGLPLLFALAWQSPRHTALFLAALSLAAALTSGLLWQRDYSRRSAHFDADAYGRSAHWIAKAIAEPRGGAGWEGARAYFADHPHATTTLVPALVALPVLVGTPVMAGYAGVTALAGLASLLVFRAILQRQLALDHRLVLLMTTAFATHQLVLRSFARPITDGFGLLLVLVTLFVLVERVRAHGSRSDLLLGALVLAHALGRPQGLGYWPFVAVAAMAADWVREGSRPDWTRWIGSQLRIFVPPLALLGLLYTGFGWLDNIELMMAKAARFRMSSTAGRLFTAMAGTLQLWPLMWLPLSRPAPTDRGRTAPVIALWAAWLVYAVALLVVVRAPFWLRHFLPALPAALVLAAAGIGRLGEGRRRWALLAAAGMMLANLVAVGVQIFEFGPLDPRIADFISTP